MTTRGIYVLRRPLMTRATDPTFFIASHGRCAEANNSSLLLYPICDKARRNPFRGRSINGQTHGSTVCCFGGSVCPNWYFHDYGTCHGCFRRRRSEEHTSAL